MKKVKLLGVLLLSSLLFTACGDKEEEVSKTNDSTSANKQETVNSLENEVKTDEGEKEKNSNEHFFTADFTDDWHKLETKIDQVVIVKGEPETTFNGETIEGALGVHFTITNNSENPIMVYPNQGSLVFEGQQIQANMISSDSELGGEILPGVKKEGVVVFDLPKVENPESVKEIRLSWQATDTEVVDVNDYSKKYDVVIPLTPSK